MPPQPWPMEVIVGLTLVFSLGLAIWVVIGVVWLTNRWWQRTWEDVRRRENGE
jgi:hypothetical protein